MLPTFTSNERPAIRRDPFGFTCLPRCRGDDESLSQRFGSPNHAYRSRRWAGPCFGQLDLACTRSCSLLLFSSPYKDSISTMDFVKQYLLALFGLWATLISAFLPRWAKRLAGHMRDIPFIGTFLRWVAPPAPAQPLPPPLPDPINVSLQQEDRDHLAAAITSGVQDLVLIHERECALLREQNDHLLRLVELQEQRPDYTYELVRRQVPRPPAAPDPSSG